MPFLLLLLLLYLSFMNIQLHNTIQNFEQKFIGPLLLSKVKLYLFIQVFKEKCEGCFMESTFALWGGVFKF